MCGLAGFCQAIPFTFDDAGAIARGMADQLTHRGPDDAGVWVDEGAGVALAHRRLAIVDLSPAGHQPMLSASGRYVLAFNGEIYNHLDLRAELEAMAPRQWRGHSDTETLLAGFEHWGIVSTLQKAVGMFALALWDREQQLLTVARDRIGEKPLYYGFQRNTLMFASELKALKAHPDFAAEIDRDVLGLYLRYCYIPAPYSIYRGIRKLLPGHYLQFSRQALANPSDESKPLAYWRLADVVEAGSVEPFQGNDSEAIAALDTRLRQAIGLQMVADVPLGAFLSGGIDSSAVVALMQAQARRPVKTFSIGFTEASYDEAGYAKAVARHLNTEHHELYVTPDDAMRVIPGLATIYDEPFADSSQIPSFLVARMARQQVAVALSGDAGDELFCGYNRYRVAAQWRRMSAIPFPVRRVAGRGLEKLAPAISGSVFHRLGELAGLPKQMPQKLAKLSAQLQRADSVADLYHGIVSAVADPSQALARGGEPGTWLTEYGLKLPFADPRQRMMFLDAMTYLPDDILVKVDRAAMAVSLETRVPFLDHRVVELTWSLPMAMHYRGGQGKWLLRQVLYQYVPKQLIERPKSGFAIPLGEWLRGPLRDWAEALLDSARLRGEGYFDPIFVEQCWRRHLDGQHDRQTLLWNFLMFQAWLEGE